MQQDIPSQIYLPNRRPLTFGLGIAIILALSLHLLLILALYNSPSSTPVAQSRMIEVSLDMVPSSDAALPEKHLTPKITPSIPQKQPEAPAPVPQIEKSPTAPPIPASEPDQSTDTHIPKDEIQPVFRLTHLPSFKTKTEAIYPTSERRAGIQANVLAEVTIDAKGNVLDVRILKSAGNAFDLAVLEALRKSTFSPGLIGDQAVSVRFQVPFRFNLN